MPKPKESRKGKRAPGMTMLGVTMSEALKADIQVLAEKSGHTSASWARMKLQELVRRSIAASKTPQIEVAA